MSFFPYDAVCCFVATFARVPSFSLFPSFKDRLVVGDLRAESVP